MLQGIARLAIRAPRRIIGVAVLVFMAAAVFGIPVAESLSPGGFQDPNSESARATKVLTDKFGQSGQQMLILVTAPAGANSDQARRVGTDLVDQVQGSPLVYNVTSAWTAPPQAAADLVSTDGKSGLIVVNLKGGENNAQKNAQTLADEFVHDRDGVTVRAGGPAMQYAQINKQNQDDLLVMELIAIPLSFLVLGHYRRPYQLLPDVARAFLGRDLLARHLVRRTARELTGRTPSTVLIDQLLEERAATLRPDQHNTDALNSNLMTVGN